MERHSSDTLEPPDDMITMSSPLVPASPDNTGQLATRRGKVYRFVLFFSHQKWQKVVKIIIIGSTIIPLEIEEAGYSWATLIIEKLIGPSPRYWTFGELFEMHVCYRQTILCLGPSLCFFQVCRSLPLV